MPIFAYSARDDQGRMQSGTLEAPDANDARAQLKALGIVPEMLGVLENPKSHKTRKFILALVVGIVVALVVKYLLLSFIIPQPAGVNP